MTILFLSVHEKYHVDAAAAATGFPGTLPSAYSSSVPSSNATEELESSSEFEDAAEPEQASRPLKTLKKLQAMLDETDYMTTSPHRPTHEAAATTAAKVDPPPVPVPAQQSMPIQPASQQTQQQQQQQQQRQQPNWYDMAAEDSPPPMARASSDSEPFFLPPPPLTEPEMDKLWTSKDRIKYKKQQERVRRVQEERRRLEQQLHQGGSSDDDADAESGTDDGLGYTLPNLSVYLSDAEETADDGIGYVEAPPMRQQVNNAQRYPPPPPFAQQQQQQQQQQTSSYYQQQQYQGQYPPFPPPQPDQLVPPYIPYPPNQYMPYPPYGQYTPQQQQVMSAQYATWASQASSMPYRPYRPFQPQGVAMMPPTTIYSPRMHEELPPENPFAVVSTVPMEEHMQIANMDTPLSLAEASATINFDSLQKISILLVSVALLCYCAVSPRNLPLADYNMKFNENMRIVSLALIAPMINFLLVFDTRQNDINDVVTTFYQSFTVGYVLAFMLEIVLTTLIRIGVFAWWEPEIFKLSPNIPSLVVPWVLRETGYMPKRITLFAADFLTTCVASPIVEEYVKLKILQWSVDLPRNFRWVVKASNKRKKKRKLPEAVPRNPGDAAVCNINSYVTQMLAASLGMKLCDAGRRILMYTKASQTNKSFYSLCRGIFPIHELCGTMTALALAKRDVLGVDTPLWQILLPAVVLHGMANFRGMKPIFKWNAATPWSEMQLSALNVADSSTFSQLAGKGFAKLMWLVILGRVLGYCIKNYYLISRQAVKRTTTYAGKHAAFSAELAATEMLKKTKDQKSK